MKIVGLPGERVRLVPSEASIHLDQALVWFNDPEVSRYLDQSNGLTRKQAEAFFDRMAVSRETDLHWAIETEEFGHVGFIALHQISWPNRSAHGGLVIGDKRAWGLGIATDAVRVRTRFAFGQLGLHRIDGHSMNPAMVRVYEKCGYVREGVARQVRWRDGRWHDVVLVSILDSDPDPIPDGSPPPSYPSP